MNDGSTQEADTIQPVIQRFESILALANRMRAAADLSEWDQLVELEQEYSRRVADLSSTIDMPDDATRMQLIQILRRILANDAEIRSRAEIRIGQLAGDIQSNRQEQRLNQAYGAP